jgi:hypothetical protein
VDAGGGIVFDVACQSFRDPWRGHDPQMELLVTLDDRRRATRRPQNGDVDVS